MRKSNRAWIREYATLGIKDVAEVGGKNASLGELIRTSRQYDLTVPAGFAVTAMAYWAFIDANGLRVPIIEALAKYKKGELSLIAAGRTIRRRILHAAFPNELRAEILGAYHRLSKGRGRGQKSVAVRSSATAEDLPDASFAGQHESYLNIRGDAAVLKACKACIASLFNDRAIVYRERNGFDHMKVALSVGVQEMVRSDKGAAGVMFTLDPESGFPRVVRIEAAWGLGEMVVKGTITPDSYTIFKPHLAHRGIIPIIERTRGNAKTKMIYSASHSQATKIVPTTSRERSRDVLSERDILSLARCGLAIEHHYKKPMDIEWARDGLSGRLYIIQARPETVQSRHDDHSLRTYRIDRAGKMIATGLAVGNGLATGRAVRLSRPDQIAGFPEGAILVAKHTDPDWVPVMRKARAIITEQGGRTSHAAIVSREFGLPAVIGAPDAKRIKTGETLTVSCCEGDQGKVYAGAARYRVKVLKPDAMKATRTQVMVNLANPAAAMRWWRLPTAGIGLARMEFIIANHIKVHPLALSRFQDVKDRGVRQRILEITGDRDKSEYFVERLSLGISRLAALVYPEPIIVRMSDFKTNEYASLLGGRQFEPVEENPMIGWRGASRYYSPDYRDGFELECRAIVRAREKLGFDNIVVMIPFCRSPEEADKVLQTMKRFGLERKRHGLQVYVMCEIPSNVILAEDFAKRFDGFSIGSNDLTQLTLGCDRDSARLAPLFREDNAAVLRSIQHVIVSAHKSGCKVGFCGQAPSDNPAYAKFLVNAGIDSISVTPDSFAAVKEAVAKAERSPSSKLK